MQVLTKDEDAIVFVILNMDTDTKTHDQRATSLHSDNIPRGTEGAVGRRGTSRTKTARGRRAGCLVRPSAKAERACGALQSSRRHRPQRTVATPCRCAGQGRRRHAVAKTPHRACLRDRLAHGTKTAGLGLALSQTCTSAHAPGNSQSRLRLFKAYPHHVTNRRKLLLSRSQRPIAPHTK